MQEIELTQGKVARVSDEDFEKVRQYKWQAHSNQYKLWYAKRKFRLPDGKRKTIFMHRWLMDAPKHLHVDHIDGDGLNNVRSNLQLLTPEANCAKAGLKKKRKREEPWL